MYVIILVIVSDMVLPCQGVVFYQFSWLIILMLTYHCLCCFPCLFSYLKCHLISTYPLLSVLILSYLCLFSYLCVQSHICAYSLTWAYSLISVHILSYLLYSLINTYTLFSSAYINTYQYFYIQCIYTLI